jgi:predicted amidohydrolase YtcJ
MLGLHASVHRKSFEKKSFQAWIGHQTVSFRQSLNAYTKIPNRFGGFENCGALEKGYSADLILLPEMQHEDLAESIQYIKPMATMLNGEWVYIKDSINIDI